MRSRNTFAYIETGLVRGLWNRLLAALVLWAPGAYSLRPALQRMRGVTVGKGVFLSVAVILDTDRPWQITIGDRANLGVRTTVIAHFADQTGVGDDRLDRMSVRIEDDVFVGPGSIILPNVTIGHGAVVAAGSLVTRSVPPLTFVQGNRPSRSRARRCPSSRSPPATTSAVSS